jgi:hypothetical protein
MQKWRYKIEAHQGTNVGILNKLGEKGWELVAVYKDALYFKKPFN